MPYQFYPNLSSSFSNLLPILKNSHSVLILGHQRTDGDCLGSQIALCRTLRSLNINASIAIHDPNPDNLSSFIHDTPIIQLSPSSLTSSTLISLDCGDHQRLNTGPHTPHSIFLNIDHHRSNSLYATHNLIDHNAAATCELLTAIFLDLNLPIDPITAQALLLGISTDTVQFRFNTSPRLFSFASQLLSLGANPTSISDALYDNLPFNKILLLQHFLSTLKLELSNRLCVGFLNENSYKITNSSPPLAEGLVDYTRSIQGVQIGLLLEEINGKTKGSLRSKNPLVRLDLIAQDFNGGGHAAAAGFRIDQPISQCYPHILSYLENYLNNLPHSPCLQSNLLP